MATQEDQSGEVYYFLGNVTSHILHALPLHKKLGGTFMVLSKKAKKEVEKYGVPVININNKPYRWQRFGWRIKPIYHYLQIDNSLRKTSIFLNTNAKVVIFYELYDFAESIRLTKPTTVFLTHGNMLKDYMGSSNRLEALNQYDYMASVGPFLKSKLIERYKIDPKKLIDIGIARTDEIVASAGNVTLTDELSRCFNVTKNKPIVSYLPTFWGESSIYKVGKEIMRNFPDNYTLLFRPHPQTPKKILKDYFKIIKNKPNVIYMPEKRSSELGLNEIIAASSGIIGDASSVMLEAVLADKPLFFAFNNNKSELEPGYEAINKVFNSSSIISMDNVHSLPEIISRGLKDEIDEKIWQDTKVQIFYNPDGSSSQRIADFIKSLI